MPSTQNLIPDDHVLLVDADDAPQGTREKLAAHRTGALHRAYSVFVFNPAGQVLLQRRALGKYHSGGLWSNTCCSHARGLQPLAVEASARLHAEMGLRLELTPAGTLRYRLAVGNGMVEHELNHLLAGVTEAAPAPHPDEASAWRWADWDVLTREVKDCPEQYSAWLAEILHGHAAGLDGYRSAHCALL